jgi:hypothetical protein
MEDDLFKLKVISYCLEKIRQEEDEQQREHLLMIAVITLQELIDSRINPDLPSA